MTLSTNKPFSVVDLTANIPQSNDSDFARAVMEGLSKTEKRLPSWLIFNDEGSKIFEEITELEHYHPTASEFEIFRGQKQTIAELLPDEPVHIIELGSGDARKSRVLLDHFVQTKKPFHYSPLDISAGAIQNLVDSLAEQYKDTPLTVTGVVGHYFEGLEWLLKQSSEKKWVLFLGSTLGNYDLPAANTFLRSLWNSLNPEDHTLIGFDLWKHPKILYRAYNDPEGVFEKFNLHLLERINQQLGANFDTEFFVQQGTYNWRTRAEESYLYSTRDQTVLIQY